MLDQIKVDYYGTPTPITQLAQVSTPEAQTILTFERDVEEKFDNRIELDAAFSLLSENQFEEVAAVINPRIELMQRSLLQRPLEGQSSLFAV